MSHQKTIKADRLKNINLEKVIDENHGDIEYLHEEFLQTPVEVEVSFYPNAISCLLSLYRMMYHGDLKDLNKGGIEAEEVWLEISKQMNESFFHFNASQIQRKFKELRTQYFAIRTPQDAENFEHFVEFHDIYQDKIIEARAAGENDTGHFSGLRTAYCDDFLFRDMETTIKREKEATSNYSDSNNHLEPSDSQSTKAETHHKKYKRINSCEDKITTIKRKQSFTEAYECRSVDCNSINPKVHQESEDMTLAEYNEHQERRHQELMAIKQKSLVMKAEAMDIQRKLLEQLIKQNR